MGKILFLIGGTHHPFESCARILKDALEKTGQCQIEITDDRAEFEDLDEYDVVMLSTCGGELSEAQEKSFCSFVRRGRGVVAIHCANVPFEQNPRYMDMIGTRFTGHGPIAPFDVEMDEGSEEILPRLKQKFTVTDELYSIEKCNRGGRAEYTGHGTGRSL